MESVNADQYRGKNLDNNDINVDGLLSEEILNVDSDTSVPEVETDEKHEPTNKDTLERQHNLKTKGDLVNNMPGTSTIKKNSSLKKTKSDIPSLKNISKPKKCVRLVWSNEEKQLTTNYFKKHILLKNLQTK